MAALILGISGWLFFRSQRRRRMLLTVSFWLTAGLFLSGSGYSYWYYHRPLPAPVVEQLFGGITYIREVHTRPRPMVVHIVKVDLKTPGLKFLVTPSPPPGGRPLPARTTSQFVEEFDAQLAINASFFEPFWVKWPRYYPHVGDPASPFGLTMSQGQRDAAPQTAYNTLYISQDNQMSIGESLEKPYNAVSGYSIFLKGGQVQEFPLTRYIPTQPSPRTAVALDKSREHFLIFVVDGRQPNYSEGIPLPELAEIAIKHGADIALNLDGGGSSTLVKEGADGEAVVLNSPIHLRVPPGRERPVANHLGIFAPEL
ncbi:MAG: phosphodiester glycosidase family protein [bacterium]|nr:phosphodiester glycosidase family protein [bacterium]